MAEPIRFPEKLRFLFDPGRYKVAYGGRGAAKSWGFARALLLIGASRRLRVLCTREVQKSIRDSVHHLLSDQIQAMGLGKFYDVNLTGISGRNGTEFIFAGLSDQTVESIKSYEGVDIVWVEEAQVVVKRSWDILIPTIRSPSSEIWVSFNPELDTDDTYRRFVVEPPPTATVVKMTYRDNPYFPGVLEAERQYCQRTNPEDYDWIWEGECRPAVSGAIYAKEIAAMHENKQFCRCPYDPKLKVHVICDLGFNDAMAIILVQKQTSELRVIDYIEDTHRTLDNYSAQLRDMRLNWGTMWLPPDAKHATLAAHGLSTEDTMRRFGWDVQIVPAVGIEPGIKMARAALRQTWMDREKASRLIECLKRYRRAISSTTNEPGAPVHDEYSHGADAFRYLSVVADQLSNDSNWGGPLRYDNRGYV